MVSGAQRRTELLRGVLDLCLLAVMEEGPAYGYEMTKRLRARGLSIVGEGSIYPLLGRLEREGFVESYRAASDGGPPRKYYRPSGGSVRLLIRAAYARRGAPVTYRAASDGGPPRKYYRPSGEGRRRLAAGVSEWRAARDAVDAVLAPVKVEVGHE